MCLTSTVKTWLLICDTTTQRCRCVAALRAQQPLAALAASMLNLFSRMTICQLIHDCTACLSAPPLISILLLLLSF